MGASVPAHRPDQDVQPTAIDERLDIPFRVIIASADGCSSLALIRTGLGFTNTADNAFPTPTANFGGYSPLSDSKGLWCSSSYYYEPSDLCKVPVADVFCSVAIYEAAPEATATKLIRQYFPDYTG